MKIKNNVGNKSKIPFVTIAASFIKSLQFPLAPRNIVANFRCQNQVETRKNIEVLRVIVFNANNGRGEERKVRDVWYKFSSEENEPASAFIFQEAEEMTVKEDVWFSLDESSREETS